MQSVLGGRVQALRHASARDRRCSLSIQSQGPQRVVAASAAAPALPKTEITLPYDIKRVLFSEQEVRLKVAELAREICRTHKGKKLAIIGVLNGAFIFTSGVYGARA